MKGNQTRGLFVTGTDTGVGKSIVTGGLAAILRESGVKVGVMKPVETGCLQEDGSLLPADAQFLREMAGVDLPLEIIVPYSFKEPLAPSVAAAREGVEIDSNYLIKKFEEISNQYDCILVEGAGGLLVPLYQRFLFIDLIKLLKLPLLIVSRATLGTINHTLLTVRVAQAEHVAVAGIVMNNLSQQKSIANETNLETIAYLVDVPIWGVLPYQIELQPRLSHREKIIQLIREHLTMEHLFNLMLLQ